MIKGKGCNNIMKDAKDMNRLKLKCKERLKTGIYCSTKNGSFLLHLLKWSKCCNEITSFCPHSVIAKASNVWERRFHDAQLSFMRFPSKMNDTTKYINVWGGGDNLLHRR